MSRASCRRCAEQLPSAWRPASHALVLMASEIDAWQVSAEDVAKVTTTNAVRFFGL